jgi:hypothetical protein
MSGVNSSPLFDFNRKVRIFTTCFAIGILDPARQGYTIAVGEDIAIEWD